MTRTAPTTSFDGYEVWFVTGSHTPTAAAAAQRANQEARDIRLGADARLSAALALVAVQPADRRTAGAPTPAVRRQVPPNPRREPLRGPARRGPSGPAARPG
jgi:hypothetical protein